ncbi:MAG TPA: KGG domain-containing protein [Phycisphaerae bacterium]|jgi:hypothetical protein|nr:KGG domain-containing protein [Phycisphaerae bacterium]HWB98948.1 KGG domain-containing protein [Bryobacteraceae bacterium]
MKTTADPMRKKSLRGFASMSLEQRRKIASMGGKRAHALGTAHRFTSEEASAAATKGQSLGRAHQFTTEEAAAAGRLGGMERARRRKLAKEQAARTNAA